MSFLYTIRKAKIRPLASLNPQWLALNLPTMRYSRAPCLHRSHWGPPPHYNSFTCVPGHPFKDQVRTMSLWWGTRPEGTLCASASSSQEAWGRMLKPSPPKPAVVSSRLLAVVVNSHLSQQAGYGPLKSIHSFLAISAKISGSKYDPKAAKSPQSKAMGIVNRNPQ